MVTSESGGAGLRWRPLPKAEALTEATAETRHYENLKQNRPSTVGVMRMNGTLEGYLKEVNQEATEMLETLIRQYAKPEGVTEALKREDQLGWAAYEQHPQPRRRGRTERNYISVKRTRRGDQLLASILYRMSLLLSSTTNTMGGVDLTKAKSSFSAARLIIAIGIA